MNTSTTPNNVALLEDTSPGSLSLVESSGYYDSGDKHSPILATLSGPCMSYTVPTRNERLYTESLCDTIHNSTYVKELIETDNFFGEPSHPTPVEQRLDLYYPYVSHRIREVHKEPSKGAYYCTIDILDTPYGRILKTLIDVGAKLGVSSRGTGRTIELNGQVIVDPQSYNFITYDIVHMPGLKSARMQKTSSVSASTIPTQESTIVKLSNQIDECISHNDVSMLESIKPIFNYLDSSNNQVKILEEKVNTKLSSNGLGSTTANSLANDLVEAYSRVNQLTSDLSSKDLLIQSLEEKLSSTPDLSRDDTSSTQIANAKKIIEAQQSKINDLTKANSDLANQNKSLADNLDTVSQSMNSLQDSYKKLQESKLDTDTSELSDMTESYHHALAETNSKIAKLSTINESLSKSVKSYENDLRETKSDLAKANLEISSLSNKSKSSELMSESLSSQVNLMTNKMSTLVRQYIQCRCNQLGLNESLIMSTIHGNLANYELDKIESILTESYRSRKSLQRNVPSPLVDSLVPKRMKAKLPVNSMTESDNLVVENNSQLSDICRQLKS